MENIPVITEIVQSVVLVILCAAVLAHSRLLGILHQRLGPAKAKPLADGPEIGSRIEEAEASTLDGRRWTWKPQGVASLWIFVSPQCKTCNALMPHVKDFVRQYPEISAVLVSALDDVAMNRAYVQYQRLEKLTYVIGENLADRFGVEGTPYAVYLSPEGVVLSKGLVNHYEHLRSLLEPPQLEAAMEENEHDGSERLDDEVQRLDGAPAHAGSANGQAQPLLSTATRETGMGDRGK